MPGDIINVGLSGAICVETSGRHVFASNSRKSTYLPRPRTSLIGRQLVISSRQFGRREYKRFRKNYVIVTIAHIRAISKE
jgi:hypothetical protein